MKLPPFSACPALAFAALVTIALLPPPTASAAFYDVIVVRGDMPTDYIVASIYASTKKIPLVLVNPDSIQSQIRNELTGYRGKGYQRLLIIGGESAITGVVENDLNSMGFTVSRLWDWNRYGTAARVSIDLWREADQVVVTNGEDYGGFLVAQLAALERGTPILFIKNSTIPVETSDAIGKLGAKSIILISGDSAAIDALRSLGLTVETVETFSTSAQHEEDQAPDLMPYFLLSVFVVIIILLSVGLRHGKKGSVMLLTEDEERIIEILKIHGKTEQSKIAKLTDFSKPKISRMIQSLEKRGIIEREKFKKTFKIILKKEIS
ncbi:MAG: MarR family transcriptional regulator [Candidatus Aenigmarchaeota archaeon]|nr:MarR family transcriptional regulator [Candidatus Aenigmarchaeota archaeon]